MAPRRHCKPFKIAYFFVLVCVLSLLRGVDTPTVELAQDVYDEDVYIMLAMSFQAPPTPSSNRLSTASFLPITAFDYTAVLSQAQQATATIRSSAAQFVDSLTRILHRSLFFGALPPVSYSDLSLGSKVIEDATPPVGPTKLSCAVPTSIEELQQNLSEAYERVREMYFEFVLKPSVDCVISGWTAALGLIVSPTNSASPVCSSAGSESLRGCEANHNDLSTFQGPLSSANETTIPNLPPTDRGGALRLPSTLLIFIILLAIVLHGRYRLSMLAEELDIKTAAELNRLEDEVRAVRKARKEALDEISDRIAHQKSQLDSTRLSRTISLVFVKLLGAELKKDRQEKEVLSNHLDQERLENASLKSKLIVAGATRLRALRLARLLQGRAASRQSELKKERQEREVLRNHLGQERLENASLRSKLIVAGATRLRALHLARLLQGRAASRQSELRILRAAYTALVVREQDCSDTLTATVGEVFRAQSQSRLLRLRLRTCEAENEATVAAKDAELGALREEVRCFGEQFKEQNTLLVAANEERDKTIKNLDQTKEALKKIKEDLEHANKAMESKSAKFDELKAANDVSLAKVTAAESTARKLADELRVATDDLSKLQTDREILTKQVERSREVIIAFRDALSETSAPVAVITATPNDSPLIQQGSSLASAAPSVSPITVPSTPSPLPSTSLLSSLGVTPSTASTSFSVDSTSTRVDQQSGPGRHVHSILTSASVSARSARQTRDAPRVYPPYTEAPVSFTAHIAATPASGSAGVGSGGITETCKRWNDSRGCWARVGPCKYRHACALCDSSDHRRQDCPGVTRQATRPSAPSGRPPSLGRPAARR